MHSHHSHSGQFCQHAKNTLEEIVLEAIHKGLKVLCLTEHMPRVETRHLYPEEVASNTTTADLVQTFKLYIEQARRLQAKYADQIDILVGFEGEGISVEYLDLMQQMISDYKPDMFIGSVHHLDDIPIDYDQEMWNKALEAAGSLEHMYEAYFSRLLLVIETLRPFVVAHFDLIRLFSPSFNLRNSGVWPLVEKAVQAGVSNGCLFEVNSASLRKGWSEPYPQRDIAELIVSYGGKFCLSDDAHNVSQVALNYKSVLGYLASLNVKTIYKLRREKGAVSPAPVSIETFTQWVESANS